MIDKLTDENYLIYAMKVYDNPNCNTMAEFQNDLNKIKYIKRLLNKYLQTGDLKDRLLLNHIITFCNTFGGPYAVKLLFFKVDDKSYSALKTLLIYLNLMPVDSQIVGNGVRTVDIPIDFKIANVLRKIE